MPEGLRWEMMPATKSPSWLTASSLTNPGFYAEASRGGSLHHGGGHEACEGMNACHFRSTLPQDASNAYEYFYGVALRQVPTILEFQYNRQFVAGMSPDKLNRVKSQYASI